MENNQNPYQQQVPPQMGPGPMTQPPMPSLGHWQRRVPQNWKQRFLSGNSGKTLTLRQERTMPNWLIGKSVLFFFIAFAACTIVWGYPMEARYAIIASISVILFFYGCKVSSQSWVGVKEKAFIRNVFLIGLGARLLWSMYCYFFFNPDYYGTTYGDAADVQWYMPYGEAIADWVRDGFQIQFSELMRIWGGGIDDVGYPVYLAIVNLVTFGFSDVFVPFLIKCLVGASCAGCIYRMAKRHFGEGAARMAALFVALNPNMIYWCGNMFKEAEMMFLCCLCIDLVDRTFTSGAKLTFRGLFPGVLAGMAIFFFRAPLAIVIFLAMFAHIVMASNRVMSLGKKIIAGVLVALVLLIGMGDRLRNQTERIVETVQSDNQQKNMEWRSKREGGNDFAKYAGKAVFAPLIFTIPFPTFNVANEKQILQRQLSGGNYIKNIFSFFVIWVMFAMLLTGEWRRHVFILTYTGGYLVTLVLSTFAQSSRFHMPIWPMLMLFAAYGIQLAKGNRKMRNWFTVVLVLEVVACLAWNWFKLAGRGMV